MTVIQWRLAQLYCKYFCTNLTSNEIFSLAIFDISTADVPTSYNRFSAYTSAVKMPTITNEKISFEVKSVQYICISYKLPSDRLSLFRRSVNRCMVSAPARTLQLFTYRLNNHSRSRELITFVYDVADL
jgi:hypothetical protein